MKRSTRWAALEIAVACFLALAANAAQDLTLPDFEQWCPPTYYPQELFGIDDGSPRDIAAADMDGDGHPEILLALHSSSGASGSWRSRIVRIPEATYGDWSPQTLAVSEGGDEDWGVTSLQQGFVSQIEVYDLNSDGFDDIVVMEQHESPAEDIYASELIIISGSADEDFVTTTVFLDLGFFSTAAVAIADVDIDGAPEIIVPDAIQQRILFLAQMESGWKLAKEMPMPEWGLLPHVIEVQDATGDGICDVVIGGFEIQESGYLKRFVLIGNGGGEFDFEWGLPLYVGWEEPTLLAISIAVGDVDQDGIPDILATVRPDVRDGITEATQSWSTTETFVVLHQDERGWFYQAEVPWLASGGPIRIEWSDFSDSGYRLLIHVPDAGLRLYEDLEESGIRDCMLPRRYGRGAVVADLDCDGDIEIAITAMDGANSTSVWLYNPPHESSAE